MSLRNLVRGLVCFAVCLVASCFVVSTTAYAQKDVAPTWKPSLSQGFMAAAEEGKALVIVFSKECEANCPCSRLLKQGTFEHKGMNRYASKAIFVHANPDKDDAAGNVKMKMAQLGIDAFPAVAILKIEDGQLSEVGRVTGRWDTPNYLLKLAVAFAPLEKPELASKLTLDAVAARMSEVGLTPVIRESRKLGYAFTEGLVTVEMDEAGDNFTLRTVVVGEISPQLKVEALSDATKLRADLFAIDKDRVHLGAQFKSNQLTLTQIVNACDELLVARKRISDTMQAAVTGTVKDVAANANQPQR